MTYLDPPTQDPAMDDEFVLVERKELERLQRCTDGSDLMRKKWALPAGVRFLNTHYLAALDRIAELEEVLDWYAYEAIGHRQSGARARHILPPDWVSQRWAKQAEQGASNDP